jgi:hypothetical protein
LRLRLNSAGFNRLRRPLQKTFMQSRLTAIPNAFSFSSPRRRAMLPWNLHGQKDDASANHI